MSFPLSMFPPCLLHDCLSIVRPLGAAVPPLLVQLHHRGAAQAGGVGAQQGRPVSPPASDRLETLPGLPVPPPADGLLHLPPRTGLRHRWAQ